MGRTLTRYQQQDLCELYQDGYNAKQLSLKFNVSTNTVYNTLHTNNIPLQTRKRGKYNKHDDNNSAQYHNLAVRQTVREIKSKGYCEVLTSSLVRRVKEKLGNVDVEIKWDDYNQCRTYMVKLL
jgi:transposase